MNFINETLKHVLDWVAVTITVGTLMLWLPPIASALSIVWFLLQIGEKLYKWNKRK